MRLDIFEVKFYHWLASLMPKKIVYYCGMRVMAYSTSGKYGNTVVPELTGMEALKRFGDDNNI